MFNGKSIKRVTGKMDFLYLLELPPHDLLLQDNKSSNW